MFFFIVPSAPTTAGIKFGFNATPVQFQLPKSVYFVILPNYMVDKFLSIGNISSINELFLWPLMVMSGLLPWIFLSVCIAKSDRIAATGFSNRFQQQVVVFVHTSVVHCNAGIYSSVYWPTHSCVFLYSVGDITWHPVTRWSNVSFCWSRIWQHSGQYLFLLFLLYTTW